MIVTEIASYTLLAGGFVTGVATLHRNAHLFRDFRLDDVLHLRADAVWWLLVVFSTFGCLSRIGVDLAVYWVEGQSSVPDELRIFELIFTHIAIGAMSIAFHLTIDRTLRDNVFALRKRYW